MGKMVARALFCGIAAVIGWILTEPFLPADIRSEAWSRQEQIMVTVVVGLVGLAAGIHMGYLRGGTRNIAMGAALGFVFGTIGGQLGYGLGGGISTLLFGPGWALGPFPIVPRTLMGVFLGGFLGLGIGLTQFNWRPTLAGLFGGLIGGALAGMAFDPIATALAGFQTFGDGRSEGGTVSRAVLWALIGLNVGLFTALVEGLTRQAWVRLVLGRNEGREWPVDAAQTNIGRDERAHIPLFGDQNVAPLHAVIVRENSAYVLHDPGTPIGVGLNGQRLAAPAYLNHGDTIMVAGHQLQFLMKDGAARRAQEGRAKHSPSPSIGGGGGQGVGVTPTTSYQQPQQNQNYAQTQAYTQTQMPAGQPMPANQTQAYAQSPQTAVGPRQLLVLNGPLAGQRIPVPHPLEIGRETTGVTLAYDTQASRRHATLTPQPDGIHVQDLTSTNGTFVNGQRVSHAIARPDDTIQIGSTQLKVE